MSIENRDVGLLAQRFFDSIEAGNIEAVADCYAEDVEIWHNTDLKVESKTQNLKVLRGFVGHIADIKYERRRLSVFSGGFVQQHVLTGRRPDGVSVELPAAIICAVRDGRIVRLDEYFDSAQVGTFVGR